MAVSCEVLETLAVLSTSKSGWEKRVSMVSWNGNLPKIDIREWSPDGKMSKGVTLTEEEFNILKNIAV